MKLQKVLSLTAAMLISASALATMPPVISLKKEGDQLFGHKYLRTIKTGQSITFTFEDGRSHYVESILLSAIGKQSRYSFARVYADGREVALLGVPGRDPDYPVVIREKISKIEIVAQDSSKIKFTRFDIFTKKKVYSSYQGIPSRERARYSIEDWGGKILELVEELQGLQGYNDYFITKTFPLYVKPLKLAALMTQASDNARDARSLKTKDKAKLLVEKISNLMPSLSTDEIMLDSRYNSLILDLMTIAEDVQEKYDIEL